MINIGSLIKTSNRGIFSVSPSTTVLDALRYMSEKNIGAVLVIDMGRLAGIFSERDYARKVVLLGRSSQDTPVRDIMTSRVVCVGPQRTVEECMALMTDKRIRHLPVIEHGELIGLLSIGDLVKEVISEQQFLISQLESYIHH